MELWTMINGSAAASVDKVRKAEREGWFGACIPDTQSVLGDTYVAMGAAATATSTLHLATAVTNPFTRHPAVTASAIATVQALSGGRAVLGIGRGDSALAHLGLAPASPGVFRDYVWRVRELLCGAEVPFRDDDRARVGAIEKLVVDPPTGTRLLWLDPDLPRVPVDVVASGPKVIAIGALIADRVTLSVGADLERLKWAITVARTARDQAGLDPDAVSFGAWLNLVPHPDGAFAEQLALTGSASAARFNAMHGGVTGPMSEATSQAFENMSSSYSMKDHGRAGAGHTAAISPEFVRQFGIVGGIDHCVERILELGELGIDRVVGLTGIADDSPELSRALSESNAALVEVIHAVNAAHAGSAPTLLGTET